MSDEPLELETPIDTGLENVQNDSEDDDYEIPEEPIEDETENDSKEIEEPTEDLIPEDLDLSQFEEIDEVGNDDIERVEEVEAEKLKKVLDEMTTKANMNTEFSRTENKYDFASEVINALDNQKTANLTSSQIDDLIRKRKFYNFCRAYGWNILANIVGKVVTDVEGYSLSERGMLIKLTATDLQRSLATSEQKVSKKKKVKGGDDFYD